MFMLSDFHRNFVFFLEFQVFFLISMDFNFQLLLLIDFLIESYNRISKTKRECNRSKYHIYRKKNSSDLPKIAYNISDPQ